MVITRFPGDFFNCKVNARKSMHSAQFNLIIPYHYTTDMTLEASGHCLGTWTEASGTTALG